MAVEQHAVTTTVATTVSGGDGHLSGEVDSRAWGYNGGRTQYFPGDHVYILLFKSVNVDLVGQFSTGGTLAHHNDVLGEYPVREGVQFSTPIGNLSKPASSFSTLNQTFSQCSTPIHYPNTTVIKLNDWTPPLSISGVPPYGFMFVEYTPVAMVFKLSNLPTPPGVFSFPVHSVFWGVAEPIYP